MKFKTSELTGDNLNRAVAFACGYDFHKSFFINSEKMIPMELWNPEQDWAQCGELADKFKIEIKHYPDGYEYPCGAIMLSENSTSLISEQYGETVRQAICRCVVASVYGDEVEL